MPIGNIRSAILLKLSVKCDENAITDASFSFLLAKFGTSALGSEFHNKVNFELHSFILSVFSPELDRGVPLISLCGVIPVRQAPIVFAPSVTKPNLELVAFAMREAKYLIVELCG